MIINILMTVVLIITVIFFLGFIGHMFYLIITPSHKLSTEDFGKKNILFKYFKNIKVKTFVTRYPKLYYFLVTPLIEYSDNNYLSFNKYSIINEKELIIGWLFWNVSFKHTKIIKNGIK